VGDRCSYAILAQNFCWKNGGEAQNQKTRALAMVRRQGSSRCCQLRCEAGEKPWPESNTQVRRRESSTLSRAKEGPKRGGQPAGRETPTTIAQEQEELSAVRRARAIISHRRDRPDIDRWHRCSDRDDRDQRSRMGHEQMAQRRPFWFLVTPFSGQPSQWRPGNWQRATAHE